MTEKIPLTHPGKVLQKDYLIPLGIRQAQLAKAMHVTPKHIHQSVRGSITVETALRLARAIGTSPEFWLNLQMIYDLCLAKETFAEIISQEVIPITL